mmetsp:Transcript_101531/g.275948  ORF Transcript_101531/g.275948 Transcript_101531/m.275948 type:complete len:237 (+) Transcript_101531:1150-1860(+)
MEGAQEDHGDHAGEEEHDHQRVQDREPVDLAPRHLQVVVPPRRPSQLARGPLHVVRERDLLVAGEVEDRIRHAVLALHDAVLERLRHAVRLHLETHDAVALVLVRALVVLQIQLDVVVDVVPRVPDDADGEPVHVGALPAVLAPPDVARGRGQVVDQPVHQVVVVDHAAELCLLLGREFLGAQLPAAHVLQHPDLVGTVLDAVAFQDLAKVLHALLNHGWLAVRQGVVPVGQLRLD